MAEYIERELAIEALSRGEGCENVCRRAIERILAADVAPVVHGWWELEYETYGKMLCSVCKKEVPIEKAISDVGVIPIYVDSNYCPNCGAKMDGGIGNG